MSVKTLQGIIIVSALLLTLGLTLLPKVVVDNEDEAIANESSPKPEENKEENKLKKLHKQNLSEENQKILSGLKKNYQMSQDKESKVTSLDSLLGFFENLNQFDSVAYYAGELAKIDASIQNLEKAGDAYLNAFRFELDTDKAEKLGAQARNFYQKVLDKDQNYLNAQAKSAITYTIPFGNPNTMDGIFKLREVVEKDPNNRIALLNLGTLAMQRGDKNAFPNAIKRFKALLSAYPQDEEARFYLAECYRNTGKIPKAIEMFQELLKDSKDSLLRSTVQEVLKELNQ